MPKSEDHEKADLVRYLHQQRSDLLAKLDGVGEYDSRRPMTPTGTNLLGLVKHVACVQLGYFGEVFGRPSDRELPGWGDGAERDADMWATADESRRQIIELYHHAETYSDATIESLPLDAPGAVRWWPADHREATLRRILVHVCVEIAGHVGHADILRELIDGSIGNGRDTVNPPQRTAAQWLDYRERIEDAARAVERRDG